MLGAATAAAARQSETQRLVSDERLRIARELHDVLAHNISLINVQAGVALHLIDEHPEQGKVALQGNLDPATLYGNPDAIGSQAQAALDAYAAGNGGSREGHVFNLGHGLSPDMNPEHVAALVDAVHAGSRSRQL